MILDFSALENAIFQLEKSIAFSHSDLAKSDEEVFEQFRNSVIQCYEFTFELSWKMLKRRIEADSATPSEVDKMSYKELIREGAERGFISNPRSWFVYRDDRNVTSHTYDQKIALRVYARAKEFVKDAHILLRNLKNQNI